MNISSTKVPIAPIEAPDCITSNIYNQKDLASGVKLVSLDEFDHFVLVF